MMKFRNNVNQLIGCAVLFALIHIAVSASSAAMHEVTANGTKLLYFKTLAAEGLLPLWVSAIAITGYVLFSAFFSNSNE